MLSQCLPKRSMLKVRLSAEKGVAPGRRSSFLCLELMCFEAAWGPACVRVGAVGWLHATRTEPLSCSVTARWSCAVSQGLRPLV